MGNPKSSLKGGMLGLNSFGDLESKLLGQQWWFRAHGFGSPWF
jgi:hypothetical protein